MLFTIKKSIITLALSLLALNAQADVISVENTGSGATIDQAIDIAVRRSIEQVKGVSLKSIRVNTQSYSRSDKETTHSKNVNTGQRVTTHGNATYRILSEKCSDTTQCRVRLRVNVEVPDGYERQQQLKKLNNNRRTIAVKSFTGSHSASFTRNLESRLVQDRKFKVLQDLNSENLDYVLEGHLIQASTQRRTVDNSRTVEMTGEYIKDVKTYYSSKVLVEYKLIDQVNQQVKWSATVPTTSSRNNLDLLLDISAGKVFSQLKENIYPLVVIKNKDGSLVFNSGGSSVKEGEYYDVFAMGEKIVDPITKEKLGYNEKKVARVQVSRVLPKVSYLRIVSGNSSSIDKHSIARRAPIVSKTKRVAPTKPKAKEPEAPSRISF
ncbi:hypothetical protein [Aliivibrio finisterrensis]|uniref:Curli production assembly/transport component CsgG n=1 Tax=Aliivibrio finisterrensis TaxID=511998 RepID=A0A6N6RWS6_9GAMM|nr:hypothetical protein [Aliivibrio finisterrensis]KAB2826176.1 hypothetical protein F8B77_02905 [Aliivibrio finisterrensis]